MKVCPAGQNLLRQFGVLLRHTYSLHFLKCRHTVYDLHGSDKPVDDVRPLCLGRAERSSCGAAVFIIGGVLLIAMMIPVWSIDPCQTRRVPGDA